MKKLMLLLLIFNSTLNLNIGIIPLTHADNNEIYSNIEKTELISTYVKSLKNEIYILKKKYNITNNESLEKELLELDNIIDILYNINNKNIEEKDEEKIILIILEKLKKSKYIIKNILKVKKIQYEKDFNAKREFYLKVSEKLNKQINTLIVSVYNFYKDKDNLGKKEIAVIKKLKELNDENVKLKNFGNFKFRSENEMTTSIIRILNNTKQKIQELKKIGSK